MSKELLDWNDHQIIRFSDGEGQHIERLFSPQQGFGSHEVQGQNAMIKKIEFRAQFIYRPRSPVDLSWDTEQDVPNPIKASVRTLIYVDKQPREDEEEEGILDDEYDYPIMAFRNLDNSSRYDLLVDDTIYLKKGRWQPYDARAEERTASFTKTIGKYNFFGQLPSKSGYIKAEMPPFLVTNNRDKEDPSIQTTIINDKRTVEGTITQDTGTVMGLRTPSGDPALILGGFDIETPVSVQSHLIDTTTVGISVPVEGQHTTGFPLGNKTNVPASTSTIRLRNEPNEHLSVHATLVGGIEELDFETKTEYPEGFGFQTEPQKIAAEDVIKIGGILPIINIQNEPMVGNGLGGRVNLDNATSRS